MVNKLMPQTKERRMAEEHKPLSEEELAEIERMVGEYHLHRNDPYAYYQTEIPAVGALYAAAPEFTKRLLAEVRRLRAAYQIEMANHVRTVGELERLREALRGLLALNEGGDVWQDYAEARWGTWSFPEIDSISEEARAALGEKK